MPIIERIENLKKFILNFILSLKYIITNEKIITTDTKVLKLIYSWKYFNINKPTIIDGMHAIKNFFKPFDVIKVNFLLVIFIKIKFIRLVIIDKGRRIKKISMIL